MEALIDKAIKGLKGCVGCGKTSYRTEGGKLIFILQVEVEANDAMDAISKVNSGKVTSVNPTPQRAATTITGSRGQGSSLPDHMQISPTPTTTVSKTING